MPSEAPDSEVTHQRVYDAVFLLLPGWEQGASSWRIRHPQTAVTVVVGYDRLDVVLAGADRAGQDWAPQWVTVHDVTESSVLAATTVARAVAELRLREQATEAAEEAPGADGDLRWWDEDVNEPGYAVTRRPSA